MINLIKNLTPMQWILLGISTASFLNGSAAQLNEWFGPTVSHNIISGIGFIEGLVAAWAMVLTKQSSVVQQVLDMPGVENISVNAKATPTLAGMAMDPKLNKIGPIENAMASVATIAKGN